MERITKTISLDDWIAEGRQGIGGQGRNGSGMGKKTQAGEGGIGGLWRGR
jgi:hypothetical protein